METQSTINTLHDLLDEDARKFISAEIQLKTCLHDWVNKAGSLQLKNILLKYLDFIEQHVKKIESFIEAEQLKAISVSNRVMQAFIDEANEKLSSCRNSKVIDACLLAAIQTINHFKISTYGTATAFARALDMDKLAAMFYELEINEKHIDDRLSQLAQYEINNQAKATIELPE
ncbi:YciE/YciF ferroxidase family protein [Spirosoma litoris]